MELIPQYEQFPTKYLQFHRINVREMENQLRERKCLADKKAIFLTLKSCKNNHKIWKKTQKQQQNINYKL